MNAEQQRIKISEACGWKSRESDSPIHDFFGLSYANYLVLPRTLLQSCSLETQQALCDAFNRVYEEERIHMPYHWSHKAKIIVKLQDETTGRFIKDNLSDYERGRRKLWT